MNLKDKILSSFLVIITAINLFLYLNTRYIYGEANYINDRVYNIESYLIGEWNPALGANVRKMADFTVKTDIINK